MSIVPEVQTVIDQNDTAIAAQLIAGLYTGFWLASITDHTDLDDSTDALIDLVVGGDSFADCAMALTAPLGISATERLFDRMVDLADQPTLSAYVTSLAERYGLPLQGDEFARFVQPLVSRIVLAGNHVAARDLTLAMCGAFLSPTAAQEYQSDLAELIDTR